MKTLSYFTLPFLRPTLFLRCGAGGRHILYTVSPGPFVATQYEFILIRLPFGRTFYDASKLSVISYTTLLYVVSEAVDSMPMHMCFVAIGGHCLLDWELLEARYQIIG